MRLVFDTNVLIHYLRGTPNSFADEALFVASEKGQPLVSIISLMELYIENEEGRINQKSNQKIKEEQQKIKEICERLNISVVPISEKTQIEALQILKDFRTLLGKSALPDSLIIATAIMRRAVLVTDDHKWAEVAKRYSIKAFSPEKLVEVLR